MIRSSLVLVLCSLGVIDGAGRPNILFAISDDQSWMHASAYGDKGTRTPAFDRIAEEGILFTHAYASCPSCMEYPDSIILDLVPTSAGETNALLIWRTMWRRSGG